MFRRQLVSIATLIAALARCSPESAHSDAAFGVPFAAVPAAGSPVGTYIKHVVIIIQENRTFDNVFYGYPGEDSPSFGYMRTSTARNAKVIKVPLTPAPFGKQDECHAFSCGILDFDRGKMDGFGLPMINPGEAAGTSAYTYLPRSQVAPYWAMAKQYVLADHMFPR